jgi:hypothetical protein
MNSGKTERPPSVFRSTLTAAGVGGVAMIVAFSCTTVGSDPTRESQTQAALASGSGTGSGPADAPAAADAPRQVGDGRPVCTSTIGSCGPTLSYKCCNNSGPNGAQECVQRTSDTTTSLAGCTWIDDVWCTGSGDPWRPWQMSYVNADPMPEGCSCGNNGITDELNATTGPFYFVVPVGGACTLGFMCV